ncbi:hypothetical protein ABZ801_01220 [Actinomadura sp. NPDC047616]|uniref:hypothetical protein n=1 Tax=Actinomadura sp. NPDC047616 TaxID=3155914 RepID=UPI0033CDD312
MTATHVNGIAVVSDKPTPSPISTPDKPVVFHRIRELQLADGTTWYGCRDCTETSPHMGKIRYHLRSHRTTDKTTTAPRTSRRARKPSATPATASKASASSAEPATAPAPTDPFARLTLAELGQRLEELAELDQLRTECQTWKNRALTAELTLSRISAALENTNS